MTVGSEVAAVQKSPLGRMTPMPGVRDCHFWREHTASVVVARPDTSAHHGRCCSFLSRPSRHVLRSMIAKLRYFLEATRTRASGVGVES